jgi:hypothetical protein
MKSLLKLSLVTVTALLFISCSGDKSSNTLSTTTTSASNPENFSMPDTLPPMPNSKENDKTLLGIDTNSNGIRDDVEIYIYNRFQGYTNSKVEREMAMQWARRAQQTLISPETAYEDKKYELTDKVLSCEYYYRTYLKDVSYKEGLAYRMEHKIFNAEFKDTVFNTKERLKAYFRYNESMSGHVFKDYPHIKDNCDFDVDALIEGRL